MASLKGGVGKTTMALIACEVRRLGVGAVPKGPVVLIDADVAGTEVHWVLTESRYPVSKVALIDVLTAAPDDLGPISRLVAAARRLKAGEVLLVPTFASGAERRRETLVWKQVLERSGPYARQRLRELLSQLCGRSGATALSVVVDLPAFDVGFASEARGAIEDLSKHDDHAATARSRVRLVSDFDRRSLKEVLFYLLNSGRAMKNPNFWFGVCVNEVRITGKVNAHDEANARVWLGDIHAPAVPTRSTLPRKRSSSATSMEVPVLCPLLDDLRDATSAQSTASVEDHVTSLMKLMAGHAARLWTDPRDEKVP